MREQITLGVLAGGQAQRLGGTDKAFVEFKGQPLLTRTLAAMGGGFAQVLASYNGDDPRIKEFELQDLPDLRPDFQGPMAGIEALLKATTSDWLLTVPVDLRDIPEGLVESLCREAQKDPAVNGVVIRDQEGLQPLLALWRVATARQAIVAALDSGDGAVHRLLQTERFQILDISPRRLGNLNTPADFE